MWVLVIYVVATDSISEVWVYSTANLGAAALALAEAKIPAGFGAKLYQSFGATDTGFLDAVGSA